MLLIMCTDKQFAVFLLLLKSFIRIYDVLSDTSIFNQPNATNLSKTVKTDEKSVSWETRELLFDFEQTYGIIRPLYSIFCVDS